MGAVATMKVRDTQPLFAWAALEDSPSLGTIRRCLEAIPDGSLRQGLCLARGRGRDDYPVSLLWGVAVLTPLLRHASYDACLAEVRRNPALASLARVGDRGPDPPSLEPVAVPRRLGTSCPSDRDAGEFRHDGSAVSDGG